MSAPKEYGRIEWRPRSGTFRVVVYGMPPDRAIPVPQDSYPTYALAADALRAYVASLTAAERRERGR